MKRVSQLSLLLIAMTLASCNEKVSPKLEEGSTVTPPDPGVVVPPSEYYFQVVNKTAAAANFNLHKTGPNKRAVPCKVKSTSQPLNTDSFGVTGVSEEVDNDITCFLEAEELALYHHGMSFEIQSSANTCDYVGYSPFSFFNRPPGNSTGAYTKVTCSTSDVTPAHIASAATARGLTSATSGGGQLDCDDWASQDIADATRVKFQPVSDAELCRFNYTDGEKEQCDIGKVTINELIVSFTPEGDDPTTQPAVLQHRIQKREIQCGGKINNCVKGAIETMSTHASDTNVTSPTFISESVINTPVAVKYELPSLYTGSTRFSSNMRYANYRRDLASFYVDYGEFAYVEDAFNNILVGDTVAKTYTPGLIDLYTANLKVDGNPIISDVDLAAVSYPENKYKAVPLAAEPFLGIDKRNANNVGYYHDNRVNPFYTFYCFDGAFDIKARIRMVVREWDRLYPSTGNIELLSDIFLGSSARMDNNYVQPVPGGDFSQWIPWNDRADWDDKIPMVRTDGAVGLSTEWRPERGWFHKDNFPSNKY